MTVPELTTESASDGPSQRPCSRWFWVDALRLLFVESGNSLTGRTKSASETSWPFLPKSLKVGLRQKLTLARVFERRRRMAGVGPIEERRLRPGL